MFIELKRKALRNSILYQTQGFLPSFSSVVRHAQGTPPGFCNGLEWRALVELSPPNIGKLRGQHFFSWQISFSFSFFYENIYIFFFFFNFSKFFKIFRFLDHFGQFCFFLEFFLYFFLDSLVFFWILLICCAFFFLIIFFLIYWIF